MGKRGPPPLPSNVLELRGTTHTARPREQVVGPIEGEVRRPKYLKPKQRRKFDELAQKFLKRGQQVVGLEDMIAVYAVELVRWEEDVRVGRPWSAAELNALKAMAVQFYDTAASQWQSGSSGKGTENPFAGNGKRPD